MPENEHAHPFEYTRVYIYILYKHAHRTSQLLKASVFSHSYTANLENCKQTNAKHANQ